MKDTDYGKNHNILLNQQEISRRVAELGENITAYYREEEIMVLALANGALVFAADLIRRIKCPLSLDIFSVSSYSGCRSSGKLTLTGPEPDIAGRRVLIVDDILDSGLTLHEVKTRLEEQGAASVRICVLLDKQVPQRKFDIEADWYGFKIPDTFVYGYGLDKNGLFRNLPFIAHIAAS